MALIVLGTSGQLVYNIESCTSNTSCLSHRCPVVSEMMDYPNQARTCLIYSLLLMPVKTGSDARSSSEHHEGPECLLTIRLWKAEWDSGNKTN